MESYFVKLGIKTLIIGLIVTCIIGIIMFGFEGFINNVLYHLFD